MTILKICGITDLEDAMIAAELGADLLGFNFFPASPRYISPGKAREITRNLGERVGTVGVFVNREVDLVLRVIEEAGVKIIQLHGDETPEYVREVKNKSGLQVVKAFRLKGAPDASILDGFEADGVLLDTFSPHLFGGTGEMSDWEIARNVASMYPRVFLAGGLSAENVATAIRTVRPYGIDVASGVESIKGRKDPDRLQEFIRNAREA